jgi:hypothetical protein
VCGNDAAHHIGRQSRRAHAGVLVPLIHKYAVRNDVRTADTTAGIIFATEHP